MPESTALRPLDTIHHLALRCRDAEQTRWFYEDILGLKLAAALSLEKSPGTEQERPFLHLFLELGDGNYIAFFDEPGHAKPEHFELKDSFDIHIAFETDSAESMLAWKEKIAAAGDFIFGPIDHDFVESVYFFDPNGYALEITHKTATARCSATRRGTRCAAANRRVDGAHTGAKDRAVWRRRHRFTLYRAAGTTQALPRIRGRRRN